MERVQQSKYIERIFETKGEYCEWFGYYNYDTLNHDHTKMLCNRATFDGVKIEHGMKIDLGYYDLESAEWLKIGESDSFNWQQGAMMQWVYGNDSREKIIYNCSENNRLVSKIYDMDSRTTSKIDWPIYGITPDGRYSISLNLERSYWCRAYHYESVANKKYDVDVADDDGIFKIDLLNNTRERIISIRDVISLEPENNFDHLKHWLEHIMINQDGTRFVFLHRYSPPADPYQYQTRICLAKIDGSELQVISDKSKFDWSHFGWQGDNFAIYTVLNNKLGASYRELGKGGTNNSPLKRIVFKTALFVKNLIPGRIRKKLKGGQSYYQYYTLNSEGKYCLHENWNNAFFDIDGHPSFTSDGRYMITDSYPDGNRMQRLIVFDTMTHKGVVVACLYAGLHGNPASCDLHPKLSGDNSYIVVDTAYTGRHKMMVFKINWTLIKSKIS